MAQSDENSLSFYARHRMLVWAGAIVVAVLLLAAFNSMRDEVVPVRTAVAVQHSIRSVVSTNGKVEPQLNFEAHAPLATTVKKVLVKEGDHVKKGQLLIQLDDAQARSDAAKAVAQLKAAQADTNAVQQGGTQEEVLNLRSQIAKAQSDRDTAQRNLDALKRLQQKNAASTGEVKDAENQLARADNDLQLLQQKLKARYSQPEIARVDAQKNQAEAAYDASAVTLGQLNVRAPFDGEVYAVPARAGSFVNPGDLLLQEADLSHVLVRAFVDEPDIGRLAPNQTIEITWDAIPDRVWKGTLAAVPANVTLRGTRNVGETTAIVDNHDFKLLPNVNVGVTIVTGEHPAAITVPREALRMDENQPYVYQVLNNELKRKDVTTAISNLTEVEITAGLEPNAVVALSATNSKPLRNGASVKVVR